MQLSLSECWSMNILIFLKAQPFSPRITSIYDLLPLTIPLPGNSLTEMQLHCVNTQMQSDTVSNSEPLEATPSAHPQRIGLKVKNK